jgi:two-component system response regulator FixJ
LALTNGVPNKIIAHQLSLSVRTIEMHRANALLKLKVRSISEVVRLARDAGIMLGGV